MYVHVKYCIYIIYWNIIEFPKIVLIVRRQEFHIIINLPLGDCGQPGRGQGLEEIAFFLANGFWVEKLPNTSDCGC